MAGLSDDWEPGSIPGCEDGFRSGSNPGQRPARLKEPERVLSIGYHDV